MKRTTKTALAAAMGCVALTGVPAQAQLVTPAVGAATSLVGKIARVLGGRHRDSLAENNRDVEGRVRKLQKQQRKALNAGNHHQNEVHFLPADSRKY